MYDNILVGVDGRQGGRDAIALARRLAAPNAKLTLANVYGMVLGRGAVDALPFARQEARELLEHERGQAGIDSAEIVVRGPQPVAAGLHSLAEARGADLLVVGSTRHARVGRILLGDDCAAALDGAPCAVAVAPRGYAETTSRLEQVGVGYDGSPESEHALRVARVLAGRAGARIKVMRVVSLVDVEKDAPVPADWPEKIDELVERHGTELSRVHGTEAVVVYGGPREELVRLGEGVDLLIVGSRGHGRLGRVVHGSVSRYVAGHGRCPVLVLPRTAVRDTDAVPVVLIPETALPATG